MPNLPENPDRSAIKFPKEIKAKFKTDKSKAKASGEKLRKSLQDKAIENNFDTFISLEILNEELQKPSYDLHNISKVLGGARLLKTSNPEKYEEWAKQINDYFDKAIELTEKLIANKDKVALDDYREYIFRSYLLVDFQGLLNRGLKANIFQKIIAAEENQRKMLQANPKDIDDYFNTSYNQSLDRKTPIPDPEFARKTQDILNSLYRRCYQIQRSFGKDDKLEEPYIKFEDDMWQFEVLLGTQSWNEDAIIVVKSTKNPLKFVALPYKEVLAFFDKNDFASIAKMAEYNYKKEIDSGDVLKNFDLPKTEDINYLRVFGDKFDMTVTPPLIGSSFFAMKLKQFYPKLQIDSPIVDENPKESLKKKIKESYTAGKRSFFVDLYAHGTEGNAVDRKLVFPVSTGLSFISADDLIGIVKAFPDAHFYFSTIGCYGGGLREGFLKKMEKNPDFKNRVDLFLQTKPNVPNIISARIIENDNAKIKAKPGELTLYQMVLLRALGKGKKFGEALKDADTEVKQRLYLDPEVVIKGKLITEKKKSKDKLES